MGEVRRGGDGMSDVSRPARSHAPRSGMDVLDEVIQVIDDGLCDLDPLDPVRDHLLRFLSAASPLRRVLRVVHPQPGR